MTPRTVVTGGAGFIGVNLVARLLARGEEVLVLDDLSRPGTAGNLESLMRHGGSGPEFLHGDVRDAGTVRRAVQGADRIVHLAGQVAVTTSVRDPRGDFEANALGTFNVLEAARGNGRSPIVLYASTNKVYGGLGALSTREDETRHRLVDLPLGIAEDQPLDPCSPYGCSKAAGDQYARDYWRIYGLRTVVFRQSCIYGPRQLGAEEQGWVAWLAYSALHGHPIRVFGDGKQVRDLLWIDDLLDAYDRAIERIDRVAGEAFNLGGGPDHSVSVWTELRPLLERLLGRPLSASFHPWRPGDQKVFVSNVRKAARLLDWKPTVTVESGIARLLQDLENRRDIGPGRGGEG